MLLGLTPFVVRIQTDVPGLVGDIALLYGDFPVVESDQFSDFHVAVVLEPGLRRWIKPVARFTFDGRTLFVPLPAYQAIAMLEWGLNWCVAAHSHQYLIFHAAVIERDGKAALLPAPPGSGKSTLCAGLVMQGWRLLSDELALYDMRTGLVSGMARPVNLKNASIDIIRGLTSEARLTQAVPNTTKGTVALLRPPSESVARVSEPARPTWVIVPRYVAGAAPLLEPYGRARTFMLMAEQSFNYDIHGRSGFDAVGRLIDQCDCLRFSYHDLRDAQQTFDSLWREHAA